jgi:hypothetical protein
MTIPDIQTLEDGDYRLGILLRAEEIAKDRAGTSFWELSEELREKIYARAANEYWGRIPKAKLSWDEPEAPPRFNFRHWLAGIIRRVL